MTAYAPVPARPSSCALPRRSPAIRTAVPLIPLALAATLIVTLAFWLPVSFLQPLHRDQGIFAWVGSVLLSGGVPYQDAWEVKGPAVHGAYALAFALFGVSEFAVRMLDSLLWAAGLFAAWRLAAALGGGLLGLLALPLMLLVLRADYWLMAQPDAWAGLAAVGVLALVMQARATALSYAAAGALVASVMLIKPHYALLVAPIAIAALGLGEGWRRSAALVSASAAAAVAVLSAAVALLAYRGALQPMIDTVILFNLRDHVGRFGMTGPEIGVAVALDFFWIDTLPRNLLAAYGLYAMGARLGWPRVAPLGAAIAATYLVAAAQLKWYGYHFLPFEILLAFPCAYAVIDATDRVMTSTPGKNLRNAAAMLVLVCLAFAHLVFTPLLDVGRHAAQQWAGALGLVSQRELAESHCKGSFCRADIDAAARFVRESTRPGEPIYLWGFDALLYVLAERPSASRYGFNYPLIVGSPAFAAAAQTTLLTELANRPPAAIVVQDGDRNNLYTKTSRAHLEDFAALRDLIAARYVEAYANDKFTVYLARR